MLVPKCIYRKSIFAKCTRLACLLSFASLFLWKNEAFPRGLCGCRKYKVGGRFSQITRCSSQIGRHNSSHQLKFQLPAQKMRRHDLTNKNTNANTNTNTNTGQIFDRKCERNERMVHSPTADATAFRCS